jgi:hypothetical protein
MKTIQKLLVATGFAVACGVQAQAPFFNGLIAYYPLNGNANDASGNGRNGTEINGLSYVADRGHSVAYFNGNSQYISLPSSISNYMDLSVSFWVKTSATNPNQFPSGIFLVSRDVCSFANDWNICLGQGRKMQFAANADVLSSSNDIGSNQWVHVVCIADFASQLRKIFLNGQQVASTSWSPFAFANNDVPIFLGASACQTASHAFFTGNMADVCIYNRALSSNEVAMLYSLAAEPHTATASAQVINGFLVGATLTDAGAGYTNTPAVRIIGGGGSGAEAVATVSNGVVLAVNVLAAGGGYTNPPLLVIDPPYIYSPVLGIAPMTFLSFSNLTVGGVYQLQRSVAWYWENQAVSFTATNALYAQRVLGVVGSESYRLVLSPAPSQAFATPQVVNGFVVGATMTSGGSGYITNPAVSIMGGGGTNATAVSHVSGGIVTSLTITSAGIGYTNTPTFVIGQPPAAALYASVLPLMRLDSSKLAPYQSYQIQFKPTIGTAWDNWDGGLFMPTSAANSQYVFITSSVGFFRLQYVP